MTGNNIQQLIEELVEQELTEVNFSDQQFSDNNGVYRVGDIIEYIRQNKIPARVLSVESLVDTNLGPDSMQDTDEVPGSPEFVARADKADVSFPIIAVEYPDGVFIADGVHRLWKAREMGLKGLRGYLISPDDLENIPKMQNEFNAVGGGGVSATGGQPLGIDMGPQHRTMWSGGTPVRRRKKRKLPEDHQVLMDLIENVLDDMGLEKATTSVRRGMIGGGAVYMDRHDPNKKRTKDVMAKVSKNLHRKPYSHDPPRMGLGEDTKT